MVDQYSISLAVIGGLVLLIGLFSAAIRAGRVPASESLIALMAGVILGPEVTGALDVHRWGDPAKILERVAEVTLAIGLMALALHIPKENLFRRIGTVSILLGLLMPLMWLTSGLLTYVSTGLPFLIALLAGACMAPTDPVVSSSVIQGAAAERDLPDALRTTLAEEAGFNDGLAYPLVFLPMLLLTKSTPHALQEWLVHVILWQVVVAVAVGAAVGYSAGRLLEGALKLHSIEKTSALAYTLSLSVVTLGVSRLIGTDGLLAVFVAGIAFDLAVKKRERLEEEGIQEAMSRFLTLPVFAMFGLVLPWKEWGALGWGAVALVAGVLLLRRLPWILLLHPILKSVRGFRPALFLGWFGPLGVAPMYYGLVAMRHTGRYSVWVVVSLVVAASVVAHGLTAAPLTRLYGRVTHRE